jgi:hypothetical protein
MRIIFLASSERRRLERVEDVQVKTQVGIAISVYMRVAIARRLTASERQRRNRLELLLLPCDRGRWGRAATNAAPPSLNAVQER